MHLGEQPDFANLETALHRGRNRRDALRLLDATPLKTNRQLTIRVCANGEIEILPGLHRSISHCQNAIAGLKSRSGRSRVGGDRPDDHRLHLVRKSLGADVKHDGCQDNGERKIHDRSHDQDLETLPFRFGEELVR